ncbi:MAG TPA: hypothetical protein VF147_13070 [Vicinamibacterales bacterium]
MRAAIAVIVTTASVLLAPAPHAQTPRKNINDASLVALKQWVLAVHEHTPGRGDAAVKAVAAYSYETREDLNTGMVLFLGA